MKKTVLITGAGRGLGKTLSGVFFNAGYDLVLHTNKTPITQYRCKKIIIGDLQKFSTIADLSVAVEKHNVEIFINNAGIYLNKRIEAYSTEEIYSMFDVNLFAPIRLIRSVWPIFIEKGYGTIVNINSIAGQRGAYGETIYCASKFGLRGFSEALQFEASQHNIRIINVTIGGMKTKMSEDKSDYDKLIEPYDAADIIYSACVSRGTASVREIYIGRRRY